MKENENRATAILLTALDREIDLKCMELKEKQKETKLKKIFFSSCLFILIFFLARSLFSVFDLSFLFIFLVYQGLALSLLTPFVPNLNKGWLSK